MALISRGAGLLLLQTARLAAALSGLMIFLWVVLLHIPRALAAAAAQSRNEWTSVFEALAISGIAFVLPEGLQMSGDNKAIPTSNVMDDGTKALLPEWIITCRLPPKKLTLPSAQS